MCPFTKEAKGMEGRLKKTKVWSKKEVEGLIECYAAKKNKFLLAMDRKQAYRNVLKEMISKGYTCPDTTASAIAKKMCALCTEYKWAKNNKSQSPYMAELEKIFGDHPIIPTVSAWSIRRASIKGGNDDNQDECSNSDRDDLVDSERFFCRRRRYWSPEETLGLIQCYAERKDEFSMNSPRKTKAAYANILQDMIDHMLTSPTTTVQAIEEKVYSLRSAYRYAKDHKTTTSFMAELEEIFGDEPMLTVNVKRRRGASTKGANDVNEDEDSLSERDDLDDNQRFFNRKRRYWSAEETLGLIKCYAIRKDEFSMNSQKKTKAAYANILQDMIDQKLTSPYTTAQAIEEKLNSLRYAYRYKTKTPYMTELELIFGDQSPSIPSIPSAHTLHVGRGPTTFLNDKPMQFEEEVSDTQLNAQSLVKSGKEIAETGKRKRKIWTKEETLGLIKCCAVRKSEFRHSRKKIIAYEQVLQDMISQNLIDPTTTAASLSDKMSTLHNAYKSAKKNNGTAPYMSELEELFGDKSTAANLHLPHFEGVPCSEEELSEILSTEAGSTTSTKISQQKYFDKKLEIMKKGMGVKIVQRAQFFNEMKAIFEERFRREDEQRKEYEERQLDVLERILEKKSIKKEAIDIETKMDV